MGVLDKFLDIMNLSDDDYDDDFDLDDDFDDEEAEAKPKKSFLSKKKAVEVDEEEPVAAPKAKPARTSTSSSNKVTSINKPSRKPTFGNMEVCVIKPTSVEDGKEITDTLNDSKTVILNLEGIDLEIAQRIIDFTCGAAYSTGGSVQMISNYIFLVTPNGVEISGDLQNILNNSFDTSMRRF